MAGSVEPTLASNAPETTSSTASAAPSASVTVLPSTAAREKADQATTSILAHHEVSTYPPMTTPWTVPSHCTWTYDLENVPRPGASAMAWLDLEPVPGASTLSCYPDNMFRKTQTGVFSPATCPHGWTTVSLRMNTDEPEHVGTTTAVCCSEDFSIEGSYCKRTMPTVLAVPISYNDSAKTYDIMTGSTTTLFNATIAVHTIWALFQEEDKSFLGLKDEDEINDVGSEASPVLTLGAKIGIGVGAGVFVLLVIGAILLWLRRKDRAAAKRQVHELNPMRSVDGAPVQGGAYVVNQHHGARSGGHPSAYEAGAEVSSLSDAESQLSGDTVRRDEEIRALRVQKAVIQRRIEELEQSETSSLPDQNKKGERDG